MPVILPVFVFEVTKNQETIVFGGGCFWCTEAVFKMLKGVVEVMSGYAGGTTPNPTYESVSTGKTGHAEVIRITYDPSQVSFDDLLTVFFATHDATTLDRQGPDIGSQYRSVILYTNDKQKESSENKIKEINSSNPAGRPIVTQVQLLDKFYPAEEYHRDFYAKNPSQAYCQLIINPKLEKVQKDFADLLKTNDQS